MNIFLTRDSALRQERAKNCQPPFPVTISASYWPTQLVANRQGSLDDAFPGIRHLGHREKQRMDWGNEVGGMEKNQNRGRFEKMAEE